MPAKSAKQRRAAGMALRYKRRGGKKPPKGSAARRMARSMTMKQLKHFARKKRRRKG